VLVADDDPAFAALVGAFVQDEPGFRVIDYARKGAEAVELVARLAPQIVLMDLDMPVMEGVAATRAICERHPDVCVIVVSGSDYAGRALEARKAGAVDYLRKSRVHQELPKLLRALRPGP
jgi:two-component system, NarL family, response regulator